MQNMDQDIDPLTGEIGWNSAPIVARDVILIGAAHRSGSSPPSRENIKGYIRGFDVRTGQREWIFHTVPQFGEFGYDTWLEESAAYTGNTGVWTTFTVDEELGIAYLPVEIPTGDYYGGHRPGDNLFGESLIAVDLETGRYLWHFQFVHHLVLFDLPLNPELLEQRIGRLDRIGQTQTIHLHTPYLEGSPQEVLARWYHEGLNAFESNLVGANQLLKQFGGKVLALTTEFSESAALDKLIADSAAKHKVIVKQMEKGRDRLLELNSHHPTEAKTIMEAIGAADTDPRLEGFLLSVFDHFGIQVEDLGNRTYILQDHSVTTDSFPEIPSDGLVGTFARNHALGREDVSLLTSDHPMVTGAVDLLLGSEQGNCSFGVWADENDKALLLEAIFVLEALAPAFLHSDRFLPPTPVRVLVNHKKELLTLDLPELEKGLPHKLLDNPKIGRETIPAMFEAAETFAETKAKALVKKAISTMVDQLQDEIDRLTSLREINNHVRPKEIDIAQQQLTELTDALGKSRIRLDMVRLIWKGDPKVIRG